jgi:CRISPR system Cascade subunit CasD
MDYHTVQVPPQKRKKAYRTRKDELAAEKLGTLLSSREYRCDTACVVAFWVAQGPPSYSLEEMAAALNRPKFTPYLGRKSCPLAVRMCPEVKPFETLKRALDSRQTFEKAMARLGRGQGDLYYWDNNPDSGLEAHQRIERWDRPQSRQRWQFRPRTENFCMANKEA